MSKLKSPLLSFLLVLLVIAGLSLFGPEEKSLGANVRIVYLHGAWVITAEVALALAGASGFLGLLRDRKLLLNWSAALGRTGIFFWATYLPLSLWAMQTNWNGLFLAEPRFGLALTFAVVGILLQVGLWFLGNPYYIAAGNAFFALALFYSFSRAENVMHPADSPIFTSGNWAIMLFFVALTGLSLLAAFFQSRWWLRVASPIK